MAVTVPAAVDKKRNAAGVRFQWGSHSILSQLSTELRTNKLLSRYVE